MLCLSFTVHQDRLLLGLRGAAFQCGEWTWSWWPQLGIAKLTGAVLSRLCKYLRSLLHCISWWLPMQSLKLISILIFEDKFRGFCARCFFFFLLCFSEVETVNTLIALSVLLEYILCLVFFLFFSPIPSLRTTAVNQRYCNRACCLWVLFSYCCVQYMHPFERSAINVSTVTFRKKNLRIFIFISIF